MSTSGLSFWVLRAQKGPGSWEERRRKNCKKSGAFHLIFILSHSAEGDAKSLGPGKKNHYMYHNSGVNPHGKISSSIEVHII